MRNFGKCGLQVSLEILDKQLYCNLVHTTPDIFENAALFLRFFRPQQFATEADALQTKTLFKPEEFENTGFVF